MKWSIAGLFLLGIGAAFCASLLVVSLRLTPPANASASKAPQETQIVLASRPLSAMSIVDGRSITVKTVPLAEAPSNAMRLPTDVVGKLLTVPVVEGQPFTSGCFADDKSGARLASALKDGMRAVSVSLKPEKAGPLYPGCIVDVLVSINRPSTEGSGTKEAMSMTLLQGVEVLAIDEVSVMSDEALAEPSRPETTSSPVKKDRRDRLVTLMVNSTQANALQLAAQYGAVSLALRNPLDAGLVDTDSTMLSDLADEYTRIVKALTAPQSTGPAQPNQNQLPAPAASTGATGINPPAMTAEQAAAMLAQRVEGAPKQPTEPAVVAKPEDPKWDVMINRSGDIELHRFRHNTLSFDGLKGGFEWIWEGRAKTSSGGGN